MKRHLIRLNSHTFKIRSFEVFGDTIEFSLLWNLQSPNSISVCYLCENVSIYITIEVYVNLYVNDGTTSAEESGNAHGHGERVVRESRPASRYLLPTSLVTARLLLQILSRIRVMTIGLEFAILDCSN